MGTLSIGGEPAVVDAEPEAAARPLRLTELIRRHHEGLLGFLRGRLRVAADAPDVAQEAYIRMMQYEGAHDVGSPSALLFRIAINVANDLGRAEHVRRMADHCEIDGLELDSGVPTPEREVAASQDLGRLQDAIRRLPPKCRRVFLLSRAEGMTYPQIARHCGISVKMVEKHIRHALAICMSEVG